MATPSQNKDRRSERTRLMLRQAFLDVVREKGLTRTSVQDIVDRANVSRGTFYAHYADKYALIETIIREEFLRSVSALPPVSDWDRQALHRLIQTVLETFKAIYKRHHRSRDIGPVIDKAVQEELSTLILMWLQSRKRQASPSQLSPENMAQIISWTIFGAALQWSQDATPLPSDQMAHEVLRMMMQGVESLVEIA